jgi:hypothetical protein
MRARTAHCLAILSLTSLLALDASTARAQSVAEGPPKVQSIRAVERGGFIETDIGVTYFVSKLTIAGVDRSYGLSLMTGLYFGYDLLDVVSISVGATAVAASSDESVADATMGPMGSLLFLIPMVHVQVAVLTTERNFVYLRGGAGFGFGLPSQVNNMDFGGNGPAFEGMVGYEHYTRLRHFSIGIQAGALVLTKPSTGIGVSLLPTLKYTF